MRIRHSPPLVVFLLLALLPPAAQAIPKSKLGPAVDAALAAPGLKRAVVGVVVESLADGKTLYERNAGTVLMPASNMKIVTAALGLRHLGPEYRFRTLLAQRGALADGTLGGDLILKGFGDPTLTTAGLVELAQAVRERGIRRVTGDLVVDDSYFACSRIGRGWSYDYLQDYYAMEVSALSLNENVVSLRAKPGAEVGRPAEIASLPAVQYFEVRNDTTTRPAGTKNTLSVERLPGEKVIAVRGEIALGAPAANLDAITVPDPALYSGRVLAALLADSGIVVEGAVRHGTLPAEGTETIRERRSDTLAEILPHFLKPSDNHFGEQIMQTVRAEAAARPGATTCPSAEALASDYVKEIGGDPLWVRAVDGSGLSRLDLVAPEALVRILRAVRREPYGGTFLAALPVAGKDGTLARRMRGTPAEANVHAKTGTINVVSSLSGYVTTAAGEPLVFSIMMNHFADTSEARAAQDKICVLLSNVR